MIHRIHEIVCELEDILSFEGYDTIAADFEIDLSDEQRRAYFECVAAMFNLAVNYLDSVGFFDEGESDDTSA